MIRPPCAPTLAGRAVDLNELTDKIKELYNKFSRLVALLFDLQEPFERPERPNEAGERRQSQPLVGDESLAAQFALKRGAEAATPV